MTPSERLFDPRHAFDHPATVGIVVGIAAVLLLGPAVAWLLGRVGAIGPNLRGEVYERCRSWAVIAPALVVPCLAGAAFIVAAVCVIALLCFREYARATGFFRERALCTVVGVGILATTFAVIDNWYAFFVALGPLVTVLISVVALGGDRPQGYLQRTAIALFGFALFGAGLGHLSFFSNDVQFRPILLWLVTGVAMNDVFAFVCGKSIGGRRLCPRTSPNKTIAGAVGALLLTTPLVALIGHFVLRGTEMDDAVHLATIGAIVSVGGQAGDLMLSSIKRDVGIKDMGAAIPGHGGFLDRFNSLLLVAPAAFHYLGYVLPGIGLDQPARILTGP